jgi:hypothetical protein
MGWYLAAGSLGYAIALGMSGTIVAWGGWRLSLYVAAASAMAGAFYGSLAHARRARRAAPLASDGARARSHSRGAAQPPAMKVIWAYTFHSWELLGVWAWIAAYLAVAAAAGSAWTRRPRDWARCSPGSRTSPAWRAA